MFKKIIITSSIFCFISFSNLFATEIKVKVDGMVCEFCVASIEKNFLKLDQIEQVNVDFDEKLLSISLKKDQRLSNEEITEIIVNNGYNVDEISR